MPLRAVIFLMRCPAFSLIWTMFVPRAPAAPDRWAPQWRP
jgi:hypothetical protein